MEADLQAFIAALEAKPINVWNVIVIGNKLLGDIFALFGPHHPVVLSAPARQTGDLTSLLSRLKSEASKTTIDWTVILGIVIAILKIVLPML